MDKLDVGGRGGLHARYDGRNLVYFDGLTKAEVFRINLDTQLVTFAGVIAPDAVQLNLTHDESGSDEGQIHWNADDGTPECGMPGGTVNLQIGQEQLIRVKNASGSLVPNGSVVSIITASGTPPRPSITLTDVSDLASFQAVAGITTEDIANNQSGYVTTFGQVRGMDTSAWSAGDIVYAHTTPGELSNTRPAEPNGSVGMGIVLRSHATEGIVLCKVFQLVYMGSLSDVYLSGLPTNGQFLAWNSSNSRWELAGP